MIGSFTTIDIVVLVTLWFLTSMFANLVWTRFVVLRYVGRAVMDWLNHIDEDEKGQETLGKLAIFFFTWMGSAKINTGKKIKVATGEMMEDGKTPEYQEIDEITSPVEILAKTIANVAFVKLRGQGGGVKAGLNRAISEEIAQSGLGLSPAAANALTKGKFGPALAEIALPELLKRLNKGKGDIGTGGTGW